MPTVYATGLFLKGLGFGFILAATVGPMWVLCLRRTLAGGVLVGLASSDDYGVAALVVLGVFLGSAAWWIVLAAAASRLRAHIGPPLLRAINIASGIAILGFAAWQVAVLVR